MLAAGELLLGACGYKPHSEADAAVPRCGVDAARRAEVGTTLQPAPSPASNHISGITLCWHLYEHTLGPQSHLGNRNIGNPLHLFRRCGISVYSTIHFKWTASTVICGFLSKSDAPFWWSHWKWERPSTWVKYHLRLCSAAEGRHAPTFRPTKHTSNTSSSIHCGIAPDINYIYALTMLI